MNINSLKNNFDKLDPNLLGERLRLVRTRTEALCVPLEKEDYCIQGMLDVSPPKWHLAHTTWFFETFVLLPFAKNYQVFHQAYGYLFNSYYETLGTFFPRSQRGLLSRPTVAEVYNYRSHVNAALDQMLDNFTGQNWQEIAERILLGIEHEIQHQELLLMDVKYNFFINPLKPAYHSQPPILCPEPPPLGWMEYGGGIVEIGHDGQGFSFDNERPRHKTFLRDFRLGTRLITNAEYLSFINDKSYQRAELWLSDGWRTVNEQGWQAPLYWIKEEDNWLLTGLAGQHLIDLNEPVAHLSYYEADAFARWSGNRLPTECEWEFAAAQLPIAGNFLDSGRFHPDGVRCSSLTQLYGDLWEWTQSPYQPYPGFRSLSGALGEYNGKFMCNQMVLRGGSCATAVDHIRASYRNFFPPGSRWVFSGLRLAEDL
ncbi:MAG: ergothioneine biosynthesis protein EgtB [Candidatus Nitrotoga sp. SPKER]|nr:MAG: ergothioneine biosynthesis protein EgtB [Candidatus Nitrotoga sp. SPKER]